MQKDQGILRLVVQRFIWTLLIFVVLPGDAGARTALKADRRCAGPKTSARMIHGREKVGYDLASQPAFKANRRGRMMGLFSASAEIDYKTEILAGCVKAMRVRIQVFPKIFLRKSLAKKANICMRKITLDHEYGHARIARAYYKGLARQVEIMVSVMFKRKRVDGFATLERHFRAGLKILLAGFHKRHDAAQDEFHAKLKRDDIIEKNCRLKKNRNRRRR